ncbi:hypothetical protein ACTXT7_000835 [Hymenolepis weldensis]
MGTHLTDYFYVSHHQLSGILLDLVTSIFTLLILTLDKETFISTRFLLSIVAVSIVAYIFATFIIGLCTLLLQKNTCRHTSTKMAKTVY